ncbi:MAG TPA: NAD(P)-dependent alcohol dehydrogenase [Steroidobacteraceae bacterium]|nr:NAD(P)-dependent alcohol dehydrogenase [Steroidobacteraceae bacterium]
MKLRNKILIGVAAVFGVAFAALAITVSYDSSCPTVAASATEGESMLAVMNRCYGVPEGVRLERIAKPTPGEGRVLIKVHAAAVNPAEWYRISGQPRLIRLFNGIGAPEGDGRAGFDVAGTVEAVGPNVTLFKPGDEVFGGVHGALGEYVVGREQGAIVLKPQNMSFDEAAGIPIAAITALQGLRDHGGIKPGQKVLINGASGGVGTYAVQIAKSFGAEVTGVCSTRNVELVRSLGADHVFDYTQENFTEGKERYDLILDNVGNHGFFDLEDVMKPEGIIVIVGGSKKGPLLGPIKRIAWAKLVGHFIEPRTMFFIAKVNKADLELLAGLAREGKLKSVIDKRFPLEDAGAALEYLGAGHARGKVVVTVN